MSNLLDKANRLARLQRYIESAEEYQKALAAKSTSKEDRLICFQNGGACLKRIGKTKEAIHLLKKGLEEFPRAKTLHQNLASSYRAEKENPANKWKALNHFLKAKELGLNSAQLIVSLVGVLNELSLSSLAYSEYRNWLTVDGAKETLDQDMYSVLLELMGRVLNKEDAMKIGEWCLDNLGDLAGESIASQSNLAIYKAKLEQTDQAKIWFDRAKKQLIETEKSSKEEQQVFINAGWNLSIALLKAGEMEEGWRLFDYGLQAPASGPQRWQRSLAKPLHASQLPIWQGECLKTKRLLILAEQAVGDTMMFLQLIPEVKKECPQISIMLPSRLVPIYKRLYPELTILDEQEDAGSLRADRFDFQIPCGSLPQHFLQGWLSNEWEQKKAKCDPILRKNLYHRYRQGLNDETPLVGISWVGGGRRERIRSKSLPEELFSRILKTQQQCRYISLQYGNACHQIDIWKTNGIDVLHDETIDPLENMDDWMAQVSCCDAVISVANTTIHGAGMLQIPTLCLRSRNSDWRWVNKLERSYWYSSVETVTQANDGDWMTCIEDANQWLSEQAKPTKQNKIADSRNIQKKIKEEMRF